MVNSVVIVGHVGTKKVREFENGMMVTLSVATNDGYGEHKKTNWHSVSIFGKAAEFAKQYVEKGDTVGVEGRIEYRQNADKATYTNIVSKKFTKLSGKRQEAGEPDSAVSNVFQEDIPF